MGQTPLPTSGKSWFQLWSRSRWSWRRATDLSTSRHNRIPMLWHLCHHRWHFPKGFASWAKLLCLLQESHAHPQDRPPHLHIAPATYTQRNITGVPARVTADRVGHAASAAPPRHLAERAAEVPHSYPRPTEDVTPHDMSRSILATFPPQQGRPRGARRPDRAHDRSSAAPQLGKARASYCPSSAATPYGRARGQIPDVDSKFQTFGCSFIVDFTEASSCRIPAQPTKANRGRETPRYAT